MRVGFDAALLGTTTTGIGLYTDSLRRALSDEPGVSLVLMGARREGEVRRKTPSRSLWFALELPAQLRRAHVDVFHGLNNFQLPLLPVGVPYVITVHDLIPELLPETVSTKFRWQFRLWIRRSLDLASAVICVSEVTKRDLLRLHPVAPGRIHVVPNGVDHVPERIPESEGDALVAPLQLPERYFLYAGALDARKNVGAVLEAFDRVAHRRRDVALVVAGQDWFGSNAIRAQIAAAERNGGRVQRVGFLPQRALHAAMQRAVGFVFPSRYEGFGLPPLEAMRLGTPAIISDGGALPETCGDAAIVAPNGDPSAIAAAMERLLDDPQERERWSHAGRQRAAQYTWKACASRTRAVYERVM